MAKTFWPFLGRSLSCSARGCFSRCWTGGKWTCRKCALAASTGLVVAASLPMALSFLLPHPHPVADPPYHPPRVKHIISLPGSTISAGDLLMSDIPWAVAWYGDRDCLWLTRSVQPDFYSLNDQFRPVSALYFTEATTDQRYLSRVFSPIESNWERFVLAMQLEGDLPDEFPLQGF